MSDDESNSDKKGKPAMSDGPHRMAGVIGAVVGVVTMITLNASTGVVPGGAIGRAIGGGGGAAIGWGIAYLIFGKPTPKE